MKKISIQALICVLVLNANLVFAEENATQASTNNAKVEAIIAEIEKAKAQTKEEASPIKVKKEVPTAEVKKMETTIVKAQETTQLKIQDNIPVETKKMDAVIVKTITPAVKKEPTVEIQRIKEHTLVIPSVPQPPKVIEISPKLIIVDSKGNVIRQNIEAIYPARKKVIFSDRVAPERFRKKKQSEKKEILPGDIKNGRVAAYIQSPFLSVEEVSSKLKAAGFEVISEFKVDKKGNVTSIVFTNSSMKSAASHNMRGFAGTLRIVVDKTNKLVNISNPIYVMKAFMQKEYNPSVAEKILLDIRSQFSDLKNSVEVVKFAALERYRFMENMPYYQDMKVIKKAKTEVLLKKVEKAKKKKNIAYVQKLENGSYVVGVKLGKRTSKFVKKIGYQNSGLLPYPILIENGEAKILAPQYYIAVMYPMLKMSQFMTIATVPGAITKDIDKIFR